MIHLSIHFERGFSHTFPSSLNVLSPSPSDVSFFPYRRKVPSSRHSEKSHPFFKRNGSGGTGAGRRLTGTDLEPPFSLSHPPDFVIILQIFLVFIILSALEPS